MEEKVLAAELQNTPQNATFRVLVCFGFHRHIHMQMQKYPSNFIFSSIFSKSSIEVNPTTPDIHQRPLTRRQTQRGMLCRHADFFQDKRLILGSQSPQRQRILSTCTPLSFEAMKSSFVEDLCKEDCASPADYCIQTSLGKMRALNTSLDFDYDVLVTSDTIVVTNDGEILEKPGDCDADTGLTDASTGQSNTTRTRTAAQEAHRMLSKIAGDYVTALSSVVISYRIPGQAPQLAACCIKAKVHFAAFTDEDISAYIATGEPFTKSGGFGLQSLGATLSTGIEGDYYAVEGFPVRCKRCVWCVYSDVDDHLLTSPPLLTHVHEIGACIQHFAHSYGGEPVSAITCRDLLQQQQWH